MIYDPNNPISDEELDKISRRRFRQVLRILGRILKLK